jgi:hypothetical protein
VVARPMIARSVVALLVLAQVKHFSFRFYLFVT